MSNHAGPLDTSGGYLSYLLRLWHTHSGGESVWRASLEDPRSEEVLRFDSLPGLFAFLSGQTRPDLPDGREAGDSQPALGRDGSESYGPPPAGHKEQRGNIC